MPQPHSFRNNVTTYGVGVLGGNFLLANLYLFDEWGCWPVCGLQLDPFPPALPTTAVIE